VHKLKEQILFENEKIVVVNKPAGFLSVPDREGKDISLKQMLQQQYGKIWTIHRLDKDTSGIIVFAREEGSHKYLSQLFAGREIEKYYVGMVLGDPVNEFGTVDAAIAEHSVKKGMMVIHSKGKAALTDYTVIERFSNFSFLRFRIHTGRTHQIRVHMKHIGHPILCDTLYGNGEPIYLSSFKRKFNLSKREEAERPLFNRLALHAAQLKFTNMDGQQRQFEAPIPKDIRALLQQLRKWK